MTDSKKTRAAQIAEGLQAKMKEISEKYPDQPQPEAKQPLDYETPQQKKNRIVLSAKLKEFWDES